MMRSFLSVAGGFFLLFVASTEVSGFIPAKKSRWGLVQDQTTTRPKTNNEQANVGSHNKQLNIQNQRVANRVFSLGIASEGAADESEPVKIIIAGAPASGKGTQCENIKENFGVVHLSTGDMLRAAVAAETEVGKMAKEFMDSGRLVPDEVIIGIVKDRLDEEDCIKNGWLLDGFPRTKAQADALADAGISADCFIFLNVPDEVLVERVVGRRTDPKTGKIYHMKFSPPEDEEVLSRLEHRSDDTEEKVKVRLEQFHTNVDAVKDSYNDISITIDGNQAPAKVADEISEGVSAILSKAAV